MKWIAKSAKKRGTVVSKGPIVLNILAVKVTALQSGGVLVGMIMHCLRYYLGKQYLLYRA
jgi:hypothetical protein